MLPIILCFIGKQPIPHHYFILISHPSHPFPTPSRLSPPVPAFPASQAFQAFPDLPQITTISPSFHPHFPPISSNFTHFHPNPPKFRHISPISINIFTHFTQIHPNSHPFHPNSHQIPPISPPPHNYHPLPTPHRTVTLLLNLRDGKCLLHAQDRPSQNCNGNVTEM